MRIWYLGGMDDGIWRRRLYEAIRADERSMSAISQAAGLGVNYVEQLMKSDKDIRVPVLLKLCATLNISPGYLFTGVNLNGEGERLVRLVEHAPAEKLRSLIRLLEP